MSTHRFILEPYKGVSTRHTCPNCHRQRCFSKYIDTEKQIKFPDYVGRCDHIEHIYIIDYQRPFILIGTTSVLTNTQNVGTNANRCISWYCIYVLYRLFSVLLWNVRYQIQCVE